MHFMMDTYVTVYAIGAPRQKLSRRSMPLWTGCRRWMPNSACTILTVRCMRSTTIMFPITDREILDLVALALQIAKDTDGAFDITVAPLLELWGFYSRSFRLPGPEEIQRCLNLVGYSNSFCRAPNSRRRRQKLKSIWGASPKGTPSPGRKGFQRPRSNVGPDGSRRRHLRPGQKKPTSYGKSA